jgi:ABC-type transport system substrate-binding protein
LKFNKPVRLAAIGAAAILLVTGCSGQGAPKAEAPTSLRLAIQAPPATFEIGDWAGGESYLPVSIFDTIVSQGLDGKITPGVAESWAYNDDLTVLTFKVRTGTTFSDGTPVDVAAVAASLEAHRTGASDSAYYSAVSSIEATDDSTVTVKLSRPDGAFLPLLTGVAGTIGSPAALDTEKAKLSPVGSGPYVLDEAKTRVGSKYVLNRNPKYWDASSFPFQTVELQVIPDRTAVKNAVLAGQLDFGGLSAADTSLFPKDKFTIGENKPSGYGGLFLVDREGKVVPALKDIRVRKAINLALDREGMAAGLGAGSSYPTNQVVSPLAGAYTKDLLNETPYDVEEAKKLMAQAGYGDGFDVTMPSTVISTNFESTISQQLADIGIRVTWETVPFQDFYAKVFGGNYGMFFMFNGSNFNDAQAINSVLTGVFNPFRSTAPELEQLVSKANAAKGAEADEAWRAVSKYYLDQSWFAITNYSTGSYVVSNNISYTPPVTSSLSLRPWAPASDK